MASNLASRSRITSIFASLIRTRPTITTELPYGWKRLRSRRPFTGVPFWGIAESAPASAFGVPFWDSRKCPGECPRECPENWAKTSTPKALAGTLSAIPQKALMSMASGDRNEKGYSTHVSPEFGHFSTPDQVIRTCYPKDPSVLKSLRHSIPSHYCRSVLLSAAICC